MQIFALKSEIRYDIIMSSIAWGSCVLLFFVIMQMTGINEIAMYVCGLGFLVLGVLFYYKIKVPIQAYQYLVKEGRPYASFGETELTFYRYGKCKFITIPYTKIRECKARWYWYLIFFVKECRIFTVKDDRFSLSSWYRMQMSILTEDDRNLLVNAINSVAQAE